MSQASFFDEPPAQAARLGPKLRALADQGVFLGTSSWKYPGWVGSIYSEDKYRTRGKFSQKKFDDGCLSEYAATFPVVCGDFAFYQFPSPSYWQRLFAETPDSLRFAFKVPEEITVARWPGHARYGVRAGELNDGFLHVDLFRKLFTERLAPHADRVATLIFEFGTFAKNVFPTAGDFFLRLDAFLADLPGGFRYAVEIRNPEYLGQEYFSMLQRHRVAHVMTSWTRMPEMLDQIASPEAFTADFTVVRALLAKGRSYEHAVQSFEPYEHIQEPNVGARTAMAKIAQRAILKRDPAFLFVNNRLEGHAPSTIEAVADAIPGLLASE